MGHKWPVNVTCTLTLADTHAYQHNYTDTCIYQPLVPLQSKL